MAKSLRSKRKKRLRTIKREISTAHYDKKHEAKMAVLDAVLAAPPPPSSTTSSTMMETEQPPGEPEAASTRGRSSAKMNIDDEEDPADQGLYYGISLKPRGGINKRRKSRGRLKKERRNAKKQQKF